MSLLYDGIRRLIEFFYVIFGDYGIAIIVLTFLVRLALLPFAMKQRKMMKNQELIERDAEIIRKKYKNHPAKMNEEIENLYRKHGMGAGCLFSILQFPIMLILYRGIRSAAAVSTPTVLLPWIPSLLARDPTYLLPLLTVCVQLFPQLLPYFRFFQHLKQQKMNPQMIFLMIFANGWFSSMLPAGIGLYYFVSGLLTALEQTAFALLEIKTEKLLTS